MKRKIWIGLSTALVVLVSVCFIGSSEKESSQSTARALTSQSIELPKELSFAGETVPLDYFDVKESLDRELLINTYYQSQTIFYIKRSARFFPVIERILHENGIPEDFKYLAVAESGLANVISPSDASGFWQFLKPTAIELGLEVNDKVDERFHFEKSTQAACVYLKKLHDKYGNWSMAAAAYNIGPNGLMKNVDRQKENNYFNLYLTDETARYVYRILAIKLIIESPEKYGFQIKKEDMYPPFDYSEAKVDTSISNIADFAATMGTSYKLLKILNPWIRDNVLNNPRQKGYIIKIPALNMRNGLYSDYKISLRKEENDEQN